MFGLIKELAERFIEFGLRFVKGETVEQKLTSALKTCVFGLAALIWLTISLGITNYNLRVEMGDLEAGILKINLLFDPTDGSAVNSFVRINEGLSRQLVSVRQENVILIKNNVKLADENNILRPYLLRALGEAEQLKRNNDQLLKMCSMLPPPPPPHQMRR